MAQRTLKTVGINHVVLHVADMDRSLRFYCDFLGFEGRGANGSAGEKMSFLRCGEQGLDLFQVDGDAHGGLEMNHLALSVKAPDLSPVVEALDEAGIDSSARTNRGTVFIFDPDGHRIELIPDHSKV